MTYRSLGDVINEVNSSLLFGVAISRADETRLSRFIASRQGLPGSYGGLFAPMAGELGKPYRLFTGDAPITCAAARHIMGEESLRVLRILDCRDAAVTEAVGRAQEAFKRQLDKVQQNGAGIGTYCCGKCTIAYWRTLMTRWLPDADNRIRIGISDLAKSRNGGRWRRYPFYYTLQCLCELPIDVARPELEYVRPACAAALPRIRAGSLFCRQRAAILKNVLERA